MEPTQEPPRRRRRAARRAAGPPAPIQPVADPAAAIATESSDPGSMGPAPQGADHLDLDTTAAAVAVTAGAADPDSAVAAPARSGHGSPGDAPGHHHPGPPTHPGGGHGSSGSDRGERPAPSGPAEAPRRTRSQREDASERSLRSLVTTRTTQVSPTAALRARDYALPSAEELTAAEAELVVVRRHYVPPTALASGRRQDWPGRRGSGQSRNQGRAQ